MAFAAAWRPRAAARFWPRVAHTGASGSVRDGSVLPAHVATVERLRRRTDFRAAATGVRASAGAFVLQARRRAEEGTARVGFTVSRQVGNAVERNRVRRRLREIVRLSAEGRLRPGHDYVLIGRRAALNVPFGDMMREFDKVLGRIHESGRAATGAARPKPLHEAGSPDRPRQSRQPRPKPHRER
jgi:ribonuclease P protein component